jgi:hypothetical protein
MIDNKLKERLIMRYYLGIISIILIAISVFLLIYLYYLPKFSNIFVAIGTIVMAISTFVMAYITYESYSKLAEIQKVAHEPALSLSLWKSNKFGKGNLKRYGVQIQNDGPGIAKRVKLSVNWAIKEEKGIKRENIENKFQKYDLFGEIEIEIGNIASKDKINVSYKKIPFPGSFTENDVYGVILKVTCEDIFNVKDKKYFDLKKIYLSDVNER